jgi:nicotinamidase-related amidase
LAWILSLERKRQPFDIQILRPLWSKKTDSSLLVNAWDNPEFRAAVEATGRTQIILGGIVTEVCTLFLALSLREAGYSVWHNAEASGTATPKLASDANRRMGKSLTYPGKSCK